MSDIDQVANKIQAAIQGKLELNSIEVLSDGEISLDLEFSPALHNASFERLEHVAREEVVKINEVLVAEGLLPKGAGLKMGVYNEGRKIEEPEE